MPTTICPECDEEVYVDAESVQGDIVTCEECGAKLEIVGLDPIELDIHEDHGLDDPHEKDDFDYEDERF